jgi:dienelactone hydrolase
MAIETRTIDYQHNGVSLEGYMAFDNAGAEPRPAVMVAHAWGGRDEFAEQKARDLAALGYAGFALDMYGKGVRGNSKEENNALMTPLLEDRPLLQGRLEAALQTVRAQPQVDGARVGAIGFCFGGLCVLDLARIGADVLGVVSYHGLFHPPGNTEGKSIKSKILVCHGYDDPMAKPESMVELANELSAAGADWQINAYGGAMHSFTSPDANDPDFGTVYHEASDKRSWRSMQDFFSDLFN